MMGASGEPSGTTRWIATGCGCRVSYLCRANALWLCLLRSRSVRRWGMAGVKMEGVRKHRQFYHQVLVCLVCLNRASQAKS